MPVDDATLLRRYASEGSEEAFRELVGRHLRLVYSAALRRTGGDAHRAQDVSQIVFAELARKAKSLLEHQALSAWLYAATRNVAIKTVLAEKRRVVRERAAGGELDSAPEASVDWTRIQPVLDTAMDELGERDREAILLRFFEGKSFKDVATAIRSSEDSARMRVSRALEKLRTQFQRHGVTSTAAAIGMLLADHAATELPPAGAAGVSDAALATGSGAPPLILGAVSAGKLTGGAVVVALLVALGLMGWRKNAAPVPEPRETVSSIEVGGESMPRGRESSEAMAVMAPDGPTLAEILDEPDDVRAFALFVRHLQKLRAEEFGPAYQAILAMTGRHNRWDTFYHLFMRRWGQLDPQTALAAVDASGFEVRPYSRVQTLNYQRLLVVQGWAQEDPAGAVNWALEQAGGWGGDPRSPEMKQSAGRLMGTLGGWIVGGLTEAGNFREAARILATHADLITEAGWISGRYGGGYSGELTDEHRERSAANALPTEAGNLLKLWVRADPVAAIAWLNGGLPPNTDKALAVAGLVSGVTGEDPELGIRTVESLVEPKMKSAGAKMLVEALNQSGQGRRSFEWLAAQATSNEDGIFDAAIHAHFAGLLPASAEATDGLPQRHLLARIQAAPLRQAAARTYAQDREAAAPVEAIEAMRQFLPPEELWAKQVLFSTGLGKIGHSVAFVMLDWTKRRPQEAFAYVNSAAWMTTDQKNMLLAQMEETRRFDENE